jgi:hypothetical protein
MNIKDGKVSVDMKIVGGKRIPLSEIVEKYKPYLETKDISQSAFTSVILW